MTIQGSKLLADSEGIVLKLLCAAKVSIKVEEEIALS